jgi:hypothetical protein
MGLWASQNTGGVSTAQLTAIQARSNAVVTTTWASRATAISTIAALTPGNGWVFVSDMGSNGALYWCNGTILIPFSPTVMFNSNQGWIVHGYLAANAATYSQSGTTLTVTCTGHNLPATVNDGKMIYVPIGTVSTGVAPTAAITNWFTNFTQTGANTFTCTATNSQTGTGFVNSNLAATTITPVQKTILGSSLGANGKLGQSSLVSANTTAGSKTIRFNFAGLSCSNITLTTNGFSNNQNMSFLQNKNGVQNLQAANNNMSVSAVDTTADQICAPTITLAANNDWMALEGYLLELIQ